MTTGNPLEAAIALVPPDADESHARYLFVEQLAEDIEFGCWFGENDPIKSCRLDWNWELLREQLPPQTIPIGCCATGEIILARFLESGGLRDVLLWDLLGKDRMFEGDEHFTIARNPRELVEKLKFDAQYGRGADVAKANKQAGQARTPKGYTWHYHKGTVELQLVPTEIHRETYFS